MAEILVDEQYVSGLKEKISMLRRKISELENQVRSAEEERDHAQFRITHELEPRIRQEKRSYDAYVSQSTGERECEWFENRIEEICNFVKEHRECFEWEESDGDFLQMILYLILNKVDIELLYIEEKDGGKQMNKNPIEYIDRELAELALFEAEIECAGMDEKTVENIFALAKNKLDSVQKADVAPVAHGKWVDDGKPLPFCSECQHRWGKHNYCPHCGARMDGGSDA